jgi:hypothetical protein
MEGAWRQQRLLKLNKFKFRWVILKFEKIILLSQYVLVDIMGLALCSVNI